jgi:hypothetical protein
LRRGLCLYGGSLLGLLCRDGIDRSSARRSFRLDAAEGTSWPGGTSQEGRWYSWRYRVLRRIWSSAFLVLGNDIDIAVIVIVVVVFIVLIV